MLLVLFFAQAAGAVSIESSPATVKVIAQSTPKTYSTNFDLTENPLREGGVWVTGGEVGLDWQNPQTSGGLAFSDQTVNGYTDPIAHLQGFPANHAAEGVVHRRQGYTPPSTHEIELLLRFKITPHSARGYEINVWFGGSYVQIVRWEGPLGQFTDLGSLPGNDGTGPGMGGVVEGDVVRAEIVGSVIKIYKNGTLVYTIKDPDNKWTDGNPGVGFFVRPGTGAVINDYAWNSFKAWGL